MHIIIGVITAIAGFMWALHSLQNAGVDLNAFNPFQPVFLAVSPEVPLLSVSHRTLSIHILPNIVFSALFIEKEDLGGTCLNRGCIPSKMLIHVADVAAEIREAHRFSIDVDTNFSVDFSGLVKRVTAFVVGEAEGIKKFYESVDNVDFYHGEAKFVENKV